MSSDSEPRAGTKAALLAAAEHAAALGDSKAAVLAYAELDRYFPSPGIAEAIAQQHRVLGDLRAYADWMFRAGERLVAERKALAAVAALKYARLADPSHQRAADLLDSLIEQSARNSPASHRAERSRDLNRMLPSEGSATLFELMRRSSAPPPARGWKPIDLVQDLGLPPPTRTVKSVEEQDLEIVVNSIPQVPLFRALHPPSLRLLVDKAHLVTLATDDVLFEQGTPGQSLYVVLDGAVDVLVGPEERRVAQLSDGEFFGEIALFSERPRGATIRAARATHLLELSRPVATQLAEAEPELLAALLAAFKDRLATQLLSEHELFVRLPATDRRRLVARFVMVDLDDGFRLIQEGEMSPGLFLLLEGHLQVDKGDRTIGTLEAGDICGEISLLTGKPAVATVTSTSKALGLMLPRAEFHPAVDAYPELLVLAMKLAERRLAELGDTAASEGHLPLY